MNFNFLIHLFQKGLPSEEIIKLRELEKKLFYRFKDLRLLKRALSHKSYTNENRLSSLEQYERYEFLGDAVLELAISRLMMDYFPEATEGDLSKLRASVVNETRLAELARKINLGDYIFLGRGEDQCSGRNKASLLSDAFEAVLGAVYLDTGFKSAFNVINRQFGDLLQTATHRDINRDYKTRLQEESQNRYQSTPRYVLASETGPDHDKTFEIHLTINDKIVGRGLGKSKKQAEQLAAKEALENMVRRWS